MWAYSFQTSSKYQKSIREADRAFVHDAPPFNLRFPAIAQRTKSSFRQIPKCSRCVVVASEKGHPFLIAPMHKKRSRQYLTALRCRIRPSLIPNIHGRLGSLFVLGCVDDPFLDVGRKAEEGLLDVLVGFGRDFEEGDAQLVCEGLALLCRYSALLLPVALVSDQNLVYTFRCVLLYIGEPGTDICLWREEASC